MTRLMQRTARQILPLSILLLGCAAHPPAPNPAEVRAILAETLMAADAQAHTASALQTLERTSGAMAGAINAIDIARDVALNNLANADTTAFKASRTLLQEGGKVQTQLDFSQGSLQSTDRNLDLAIQGNGFFKIQIAANVGNGIAYTRCGNFFVNGAANLVLGMGDGYKLIPPIAVPSGTSEILISTEGHVSVMRPGSAVKIEIGEIKLTRFPNPEGLNVLGGGLFAETDFSGRGADSAPGDRGAGTLLQGFLERSNVDITREMIRLHYLNQWRSSLLRAIGMQDH